MLQYKSLRRLRSLRLAFPCNQFGKQEEDHELVHWDDPVFVCGEVLW